MRFPTPFSGVACLLALASGTATVSAQSASPVITVEDQSFDTWSEYTGSHLFQSKGLRCAFPDTDPAQSGAPEVPGDCSLNLTRILAQYEPTNGLIQIPVVMHVIMHSNGQGSISDAQINNQIQILNEDFRAIAGSNGANGNDGMIQFYLADRDPSGNPTTGITRSTNNTWYNDGGSYWNTLAWDTDRYLNIYTNSASGALGYVPGLPQNGIVGSNGDRVVVLWSSVGLNGPIGPPFNKGRTVTHEVGHYLGLYHTFNGSCASASNCYSNGDRICDTNPEAFPHNGCNPSQTSCGGLPVPLHNYMDYSNDLCMWEFTPEQINRMRCTLMNWRPNLARPPATCTSARVVTRNGTTNFVAYTATPPVISQPVQFDVDTNGFQFATIYAFPTAGSRRLDNGYTVLVNPDASPLFVLGPLAGPTASTSMIVANDPSMCGQTIYTQVLLNNGPGAFALTNSQDLVVGN